MSLRGLAHGRVATAHGGLNSHLPAGLRQQLLVWPHWMLLVEGDQGIQRGVGPFFPRDQEGPIIQKFHHDVAAAALGSVGTLPG